MHSIFVVISMPKLIKKVKWRAIGWMEAYRLPTPVFLGFPGCSDGKESACNVGDLGSIPGWKDPLEEGMGTNSRTGASRVAQW